MLELYLLDWLSLSLKFLHIIAGIAWIGASFYFNWLENKLQRADNREGIAGHLWAIHGGGFYYLEKYQVYPKNLPEPLHWFKWEAYVTWISGVLLLAVTYYFNASVQMLDATSPLSTLMAVLLSVFGLLVFWVFYDALCKTKLVDNSLMFIIVICAALVLATYGYDQIYTAKATFMQIGAMIGTVMAANVFFIIMPVQRELVKACVNKHDISASLGYRGYIRSRHNNYLTLPVLFIMISNHYPFVYSSDYNYLILICFFAIAVCIRHYFNLRGVGKQNPIWIVVLVVLMGLMMLVLAPKNIQTSKKNAESVDFVKVKTIIKNHCISCHSANPTDSVFISAPNGFVLDTDAQINNAKSFIYQRSVATLSMPLGNKTHMSKKERALLGQWFLQSP